MTRLPRVSGKKVIAALERAGFSQAHSRGSHVALTHNGGATVIVPVHGNRDIPPGTLRAILSQANLSVDELIALLND